VADAKEAPTPRGDASPLPRPTAERRRARGALGRPVDDVLSADQRPRHHHDEVLGAIEADVTAEVASGGAFGLRDDLELPERPAKERPTRARDRVAERREAQARAALEAAEARAERAGDELEHAAAALAELRERHGT